MPPTTSDPGLNGKPRVLLVEDDPDVSQMIQDALEEAAWNVTAVADGVAALEALSDRPFHLVVLDLMLPRMSGTQVSSEIRAQNRIPILVISAKSQLSDVLWALQLGAEEYIVKPFDVRELVARAQVILRRGYRPEGWILRRRFRHGELSVDFRERVADIRGKRVRLSPTECRLLACLSAEPGSIASHRDLMTRVWGSDAVNEKRYLKLYISYLRRKLERDPRRPELLVSERGLGYRLCLSAVEPAQPGV